MLFDFFWTRFLRVIKRVCGNIFYFKKFFINFTLFENFKQKETFSLWIHPLIILLIFSKTATNIVEVYINSHGTASSRCPSNGLYQNDSENTVASGSKSGCASDNNKSSWSQVRGTWSSTSASQELTPTTQTKITSSSKRRNPALRRYVSF